MFRLSHKMALLISLPCIIPIILIIFDFFSPKKDIKTAVRDKSSFKGYKVYFNGSMANVSSEKYNSFNIGDSVIVKTSSLFNTVDEIKNVRSNEIISTSDSYWAFFCGLLFLSPFLMVFVSIVRNSYTSLFSDSSYIGIYWISLSVTYLIILIFVCVNINPKP